MIVAYSGVLFLLALIFDGKIPIDCRMGGGYLNEVNHPTGEPEDGPATAENSSNLYGRAELSSQPDSSNTD